MSMFRKKKLYCLKFSIKDNPRTMFGNGDNKFLYEYIATTNKMRAIKKSKLLKEGKFAFISIREMQIEK